MFPPQIFQFPYLQNSAQLLPKQSQNDNAEMAVELRSVESLDFCQKRKKKLDIITYEGISLSILNFMVIAERGKKICWKNMKASDFPFSAR